MNQLDFNGRVAVITGGATGIGLAVAQRLVASGGKVSLWDRDAALLNKVKAAFDADTQVVDVAEWESVDRAAQATAKALGRVDALVCSAGITGPNTTTWEYPVDAWRQVIDVNLNGVFHCNRAIVPLMREARLRPDREHRLGCGQGRQSERVGVQRVEGRRDRADQVAGQGAREERHPRQLRDARRGEDGDLRPDVAAAHRLHAVEDSAGTLRHWWTRSRRSSRGFAPRTARSRPARCSISRADARRTSEPRKIAATRPPQPRVAAAAAARAPGRGLPAVALGLARAARLRCARGARGATRRGAARLGPRTRRSRRARRAQRAGSTSRRCSPAGGRGSLRCRSTRSCIRASSRTCSRTAARAGSSSTRHWHAALARRRRSSTLRASSSSAAPSTSDLFDARRSAGARAVRATTIRRGSSTPAARPAGPRA